jgi:hypothetical protein
VIVVSILLPHAKNKDITPSLVKPIAGSQNESPKGKVESSKLRYDTRVRTA